MEVLYSLNPKKDRIEIVSEDEKSQNLDNLKKIFKSVKGFRKNSKMQNGWFFAGLNVEDLSNTLKKYNISCSSSYIKKNDIVPVNTQQQESSSVTEDIVTNTQEPLLQESPQEPPEEPLQKSPSPHPPPKAHTSPVTKKSASPKPSKVNKNSPSPRDIRSTRAEIARGASDPKAQALRNAREYKNYDKNEFISEEKPVQRVHSSQPEVSRAVGENIRQSGRRNERISRDSLKKIDEEEEDDEYEPPSRNSRQPSVSQTRNAQTRGGEERSMNSPIARAKILYNKKSPVYITKHSDKISYYKNLGKKHTEEISDSSTSSDSDSDSDDFPDPPKHHRHVTPPGRRHARK